ncbi:MAG: ABC transporter ATP-binding protein [Clostridia bacterium]|jgi:spermidine/putrescine ABC transporter ATP-binding subunit|nr:ABC transporter ATP-binding protein [Clostridia bacterium]
MSTVVLKGLVKKYGQNTVVKGIDLTAEDGKLVSILGPSGCGKTTTLRMIAGFEKTDGGEVYFDDKPMGKVPVNKRNIGMVFQSYALFPHMTVFDNIAYGLCQRKIKPDEINKRVEEIMKLVHMEEYSKRKPKELSGGQQQRVALARALVIKPDVLLLDECLSALDKKLRVEMQVELRRILEETGVTTFFVTHDQEEAMTLSDKIVVMNNGAIEQVGTPYEVYEKPNSRFVAGFLGKANFFEGKVTNVNSDEKYVVLENEKGTVAIPAEKAKIGENVLYAVRPEKMRISKEPKTGALKGIIEHITYSGNISTCNINCGGESILCEVTNDMISERPQRGDKVFVTWDSASSVKIEV